jgi:hypothetical protein
MKQSNPFRRYHGPCVGHCARRDPVRLWWCHLCDRIGCWNWLINHTD